MPYRPDKLHPGLTVAEHEMAFAALAFAEQCGWPINVAITVHWALAGGPGGGTWRERQSRLLERLRHWLRYRSDCPPAYIWAAEQSPTGKDVHTHFALHLPTGTEIANLRRYLDGQIVGDDAKALDVQSCSNHPRGAIGWIAYITKSVEVFAPRLVPHGLHKKHGAILGPRFRVSHSIGPLARMKHIFSAPSKGTPAPNNNTESADICRNSQASCIEIPYRR